MWCVCVWQTNKTSWFVGSKHLCKGCANICQELILCADSLVRIISVCKVVWCGLDIMNALGCLLYMLSKKKKKVLGKAQLLCNFLSTVSVVFLYAHDSCSTRQTLNQNHYSLSVNMSHCPSSTRHRGFVLEILTQSWLWWILYLDNGFTWAVSPQM